jgi:hypothetical protein
VLLSGATLRKNFLLSVSPAPKASRASSELVRTLLAAPATKWRLHRQSNLSIIGDESEPNLFKMTMPGRAYLQKFLRRLVDAGARTPLSK